jgi:hypothetical protein
MSAELSRRPESIFYRHAGTLVTSRFFIAGETRYRVGELTSVTRSQGSVHPGVKVGLAIVLAELIIMVPVLMMSQSFAGVAVMVPALAIPAFVSYFCAWRWPPALELAATYRGRAVILFATADEQEFGQVARALLRAIESLQ